MRFASPVRSARGLDAEGFRACGDSRRAVRRVSTSSHETLGWFVATGQALVELGQDLRNGVQQLACALVTPALSLVDGRIGGIVQAYYLSQEERHGSVVADQEPELRSHDS